MFACNRTTRAWSASLVLMLGATIVAALAAFASAPAAAADTELVSVNTFNGDAAGHSALRGTSTVSADGRYVVFQSIKYSLVPGDTNRLADIFVRDRTLGITQRVSVASDGTQSNRTSDAPAISADGRYVVFQSVATNLVPGPGDPNRQDHIYLHDRLTGRTELVSAAFDGGFPDGGSYTPVVSADGRYVAYMSTATNLIAGYEGVQRSVYVRDRQAGRTELINAGWAYSVAINADGRYVAFDTDDIHTTSPNVYVRDRTTGSLELISVTPAGAAGIYGGGGPSLSADGRYVAFGSWSFNLVPDDSNGRGDVFVRDRLLRTTTRVSVDDAGRQLALGGYGAAISGDGRFVAFGSDDPFAVAGDVNGATDVFVRDIQLQRTLLATVSSTGGQLSSDGPLTFAINTDGRFVAFDSYAAGFVPNDLNLSQDVFVHDFGSGTGPAGPTFTLKPLALDFGKQTVGTSVEGSLWLRNTGDAPLSVSRVWVRGDAATMFSASSLCGTPVPAGSGCAIRVTYRPTAPGTHLATLVVVVDGVRRDRMLSGVGVSP